MRIIISPAKKMRVDTDGMEWRDLPVFLAQTEQLLEKLRSLSAAELQKMWKCNDQIAALNVERIAHMDLRQNLTPAVLAYEGIQYQYMSPEVFTNGEYDYVQEHLRILSGFYGLLRPFDGVVPYRLEMQAKLNVDGKKDLYAFWGDRLARMLLGETGCVVNLASKEYSQCIARYLPEKARFITCVFGEAQGGKIVEKGTMCKMARGEMVRFMAENRVSQPEELRTFNRLDYAYSPEHSAADTFVFLRQRKEAEPAW